MMKKILPYIIGIVTMLSACSDQDMTKQNGNTGLPDEVNLTFSFTIPEQTEVYTRSIDPDGEPIASIWLFLFNNSGYYLGHVRANKVTYEQSNENNGYASGTFSAPTIPSTVRRIHFIANYNAADVDDSELLNRTEKEVMTRFISSSGRLVYWGRKKFSSEDELRNYFNGNKSDPIVLYRNQAAITYENNANLKIKGFAICNTYAKGTVVPYNHKGENVSGHDPFDFDLISEDVSHAEHDFVTLCSGDDLIKATDPTDIVVENEWNNLQYVFEHENTQDDPMYAIFKIGERFYKLLIVDKNLNPYKIIRNHRYIFNFVGIPPTNLGYGSFDEAKNGVAANNVWVSIDDELPSIGDGNSSLTIDGETTRIYTEQKEEVINFTYEGGNLNEEVTAQWLTNEGLADSDLNLQYNSSTGKGSITIDLNAISDTPQYGTLQIKAGKYPRTIQIIYLNKFEFTPVWTSSSVPRKSGEPVSIVFNIPDTYPEELYPIECKISCNLFDADNANRLDVIEEETVFTIDGKTIERDWDYKYVYKIDKPGLHRVDFKTLVNEYPENPDNPSENVEDLTWFLEAPYFNTIQRTINMVDASLANQKIIIKESGTGSYERKLLPIKGQQFDLKFKLDGGGIPAGTNVRIYMDDAVESGYYEGDNWADENLSEEKNDASDAGRYFIYIVPDSPGTDGYYSIPFYTTRAQCAGYARLAAADVDNDNDPEHCYKSAIVTRVNYPDAYKFNMEINNTEVVYGTGRPVDLTIRIAPPVEIIDAATPPTNVTATFFIQTNNLEPTPDNTYSFSKVDGGYEVTINNLMFENDYIFQMQTKDIVSAETVAISEISGNVAIDGDAVTFTNQTLSGNITVNGLAGGFRTDSPFIALEKSDGTRIGAFDVESTVGSTEGIYTLTLRGEYDFTEDEELTVIYSPLESSEIYVGKTNISELLTSPTLTLNLQQ